MRPHLRQVQVPATAQPFGWSGLADDARYLATALKARGFEAYTINAASKKLRTVIMMTLVIRRDRRRRAI